MQHWYYIYVCTYGWACTQRRADIRYGICSHSSFSSSRLSVQDSELFGAQRRRHGMTWWCSSYSRSLFFIGEWQNANKQSGSSFTTTLLNWSWIATIPFSYMIWFQSHILKVVSGPLPLKMNSFRFIYWPFGTADAASLLNCDTELIKKIPG